MTVIPTFPSLPGLSWPVKRTGPQFDTVLHDAVSGKQNAYSKRVIPKWSWELTLEFLRDSTALPEVQTLMGFHATCRGRARLFQFRDPIDNAATDEVLGTGNGTTTSFQLIRELGGFIEPVQAPVIRADVRTNLVTNSSDPTIAALWSANLATFTLASSSIPAPIGPGLVYKIEETAATGIHYASVSTSAAVAAGQRITASAYIKAAERSAAALRVNDGVQDITASFNLAAAVVSVPPAIAGASAVIEPLANGWFRASITFTPLGAILVSPLIAPETTSGVLSYLGVAGSGLYFWGVQVELGESPTAFIPTINGMESRTDYLPRIVNTVHGEHRPLSPEPHKNAIAQSGFASGWTATNAALEVSGTNPNGGTAMFLREDTSTGAHSMVKTASGSFVAGTTVTGSVYVYPSSRTFVRLDLFDGAAIQSAYFDPIGGVCDALAGNASITQTDLPWVRLSFSIKIDTTTSALTFGMALCDVYQNASYTGTSSGMYFWGAQVEPGTTPMTHIPTTTTSITAADYANQDGGVIAFTSAPVSASSLMWSGPFNWLCRFDDDKLDFSQFMSGYWSTDKVSFTSVLL